MALNLGEIQARLSIVTRDWSANLQRAQQELRAFQQAVRSTSGTGTALGQEIERITGRMQKDLQLVSAQAQVFGRSFHASAEAAAVLRAGIRDLLAAGVSPASAQIQSLVQQLHVLEQQAEGASAGFVRLRAALINIGAVTGAIFVVAMETRRLARFLNDLAQTAFMARTGMEFFQMMMARANQDIAAGTRAIEELSARLRTPVPILASAASEMLRIGFNMQQIVPMMEAAAASGLRMGKAPAESIRILTEALVSQRSVMLNLIGITENFDVELQRAARSMGITRDQMTKLQEAQAIYNFILRVTRSEVADMPRLFQGYGGAIADLSAALYELKVAMGDTVIPIVTAFARLLGDAVRTVNEADRAVRGLTGALMGLATALTTLGGLKLLGVALPAWAKALIAAVSTIGGFLLERFGTASEGAQQLQQQLEELRQQGLDLGEGMAQTGRTVADVMAEFERGREIIERMTQARRALSTGFSAFPPGTFVTFEYDEMQARVQNAMRALEQLFSLGAKPESKEVKRVLDELGDALVALYARTQPVALGWELIRRAGDDLASSARALQQTIIQLNEEALSPSPLAAARAKQHFQNVVEAITEAFIKTGDIRQAVEAGWRELAKQAADVVSPAVTEARDRIRRVLEGREPPTSWAALKLFDEATIEEGLRESERRVKQWEEQIHQAYKNEVTKLQLIVSGRLEPVSWAQVKFLDESTIQQGIEAGERRLKEWDEQIRQAYATAVTELQLVVSGRRDPVSWAQVKFLDEATVQQGVEAAEKVIEEAARRLSDTIQRTQRRVQDLLRGEQVPISWAELKLYDASTIQSGLDEANRRWDEWEQRASWAYRTAATELQLIISGQKSPVSWAQAKFFDESTIEEGIRAAEQALQDAYDRVVAAWRQARMKFDAMLEGRILGTAPGHFRVLENVSVELALRVETKAERTAEQAWAEFIKSLTERLGSSLSALENVVQAMQTMAPAGPIGMAAGALVAMVTNSSMFAGIMERVNPVLQQLADVVGRLLGAIAPLIQSILSLVQVFVGALQPVVSAIANAIGALFVALAPVIQVIGQVLAPVFAVVGAILTALLVPAFQALFPVIKLFGMALGAVAWVIGQIWNGLISVLQAIFRALASIRIAGWHPLGFLDKWADSMEKMKVNTDAIAQALVTLAGLTWEQAQATAANIAAQMEATKATQEFTEQLTNVPEGFKVALLRYESMTPVPMQHGGIATAPTLALVGERGPEAVVPLERMGSMGRQVVIEQVVIQSDDPERIWRELQRIIERENVRSGGTVVTRAPTFVG